MEGEPNSKAEITRLSPLDRKYVEDLLANKGEIISCVMEKVLLAPKQMFFSQHVLFRTRYTIEDKVCELILESGCTKNIKRL